MKNYIIFLFIIIQVLGCSLIEPNGTVTMQYLNSTQTSGYHTLAISNNSNHDYWFKRDSLNNPYYKMEIWRGGNWVSLGPARSPHYFEKMSLSKGEYFKYDIQLSSGIWRIGLELYNFDDELDKKVWSKPISIP